jgi:adenylate kinase
LKVKVCIITGTPGTGKTLLAKKLGKKLNSRIIFLNELIREENHILGYDEDRDTSIANFKTLIPRLKELIKNYKKEKNIDLIIIEGHYSDVVPKKLIDYAIALRCHPDELNRRLKERDYREQKIKENIQAEILSECTTYLIDKEIKSPILEIDTSTGNFNEIVDNLHKIFVNGCGFEIYELGKVDWLDEIYEKNRLKEFFD